MRDLPVEALPHHLHRGRHYVAWDGSVHNVRLKRYLKDKKRPSIGPGIAMRLPSVPPIIPPKMSKDSPRSWSCASGSSKSYSLNTAILTGHGTCLRSLNASTQLTTRHSEQASKLVGRVQ
jgi:hypothetical protein